MTLKTERTRHGRRIAGALAVSGMIAATLWSGAATAAAQPDHCQVGNVNNGKTWEGESTSGNGWFRFYERGEKLIVADRMSNGTRAVAQVSDCASGRTRSYDSGPNEGDWDQEVYYLSRSEGQVLFIRSCDAPQSHCGPWRAVNT